MILYTRSSYYYDNVYVLQVYLAHTEDVGADVAHCGYLVHHKIYSETDHSDLTEPTECFTDYLIPGRPLAGYGLHPPEEEFCRLYFLLLKPNVLQGFCNMLAL